MMQKKDKRMATRRGRERMRRRRRKKMGEMRNENTMMLKTMVEKRSKTSLAVHLR